MAKRAKAKAAKQVETIRHTGDTRVNIPTAEHQSVIDAEQAAPRELRYPRNTDLDPQLVWRGKDYEDWSDLVVQAPPLYIQEKVHPKALVDDLLEESRRSPEGANAGEGGQIDLFADFNGIGEGADRTDFYQHDQNWTNRMILGDSLQVMASLAEREGLRGKVQCIYIDPPYGIKFNSNFQWSTTSRDVKDGNAGHITREPEQVKAFRDTWKDGIHSYLTHLRDRLTIARDLLTESGSVFLQISDENVHRVRCLMDEVFGEDNFCSLIFFSKTTGTSSGILPSVGDLILWYSRSRAFVKFRPALRTLSLKDATETEFRDVLLPDLSRRKLTDEERADPRNIAAGARLYRTNTAVSPEASPTLTKEVAFRCGVTLHCGPQRHWKTADPGLLRLEKAERLDFSQGPTRLFRRYFADNEYASVTNVWTDTRSEQKQVYVVQTKDEVIKRCILMTSDPGDLVLDPTCGSGTTAVVSEQWGRRWITVDTSRVALALARARVMGARFPYYILADSREGQQKDAALSRRQWVERPAHGNVRHGFVYERAPHIEFGEIAANAEIDVVFDDHGPAIRAALEQLNAALRGLTTPFQVTVGGRQGNDVHFDASAGETFMMPSGEAVSASQLVEWEVPRVAPADWPEAATKPLANFWEARIARQKAIDASIAAKAKLQYLYDRPYEDKKAVRVAGPFTVESLSPHRMLGVDENDELIDPLQVNEAGPPYGQSFEQIILENLRTAGVQQAHKADRITFTSLIPWPGELICAEGRYIETETQPATQTGTRVASRPGATSSDEEGSVTKRGGGAPRPERTDDIAPPSNPDGREKRAAIFIGPEFGTVSRPDLVQAAREAGDAGFDVLIACAFNYEALASEFSKLGRIPVLKARMNADLHMGGALKPTGTGNLFVVFGEPDIDILHVDDGQVRVQVKGVDVFDPSTGEVRSDSTDGIACWFIDTDYNEESFFVRHAYFLGQNDPYGALKTTLKAEIDPDTWATLNSDISRPFPMPKSGRIAVKVINHLGDEVMKVFRVE
jgi:adenine-specific DNA-methyltransferase